MISHIDIGIGLVAVLTLVRAARRPHPAHPTTAILLTLLTGVLLWANLRPIPHGKGSSGAWTAHPGWTQSRGLCSGAGGPSPHAWSASFTACDSIPTALNNVSWFSTESSFWSPSTSRRPLASDFYGGVVTLTSEVWTSGYPLVADILPPKPPLSLAAFPSHLFPAIPLTPLLSLSKY